MTRVGCGCGVWVGGAPLKERRERTGCAHVHDGGPAVVHEHSCRGCCAGGAAQPDAIVDRLNGALCFPIPRAHKKTMRVSVPTAIQKVPRFEQGRQRRQRRCAQCPASNKGDGNGDGDTHNAPFCPLHAPFPRALSTRPLHAPLSTRPLLAPSPRALCTRHLHAASPRAPLHAPLSPRPSPRAHFAYLLGADDGVEVLDPRLHLGLRVGAHHVGPATGRRQVEAPAVALILAALGRVRGDREHLHERDRAGRDLVLHPRIGADAGWISI